MSPHEETLVQVAKELRHHFPSRLKQVLLFGSQARGEASQDSDYDCVLVFDCVTPAIKTELERLAGDYLVQHGLVLSCIPLSETDLERLRYEPFLINAKKEGLTL